MALTISHTRITKILETAKSIDISSLDASEAEKVKGCITLLTDKRINFDYLSSRAGCPYYYDTSSVRLCDMNEDDSKAACDKCWFINLSEHITADDEKKDVSVSMEDDVAAYKKLYAYESTGMTPAMITQVLNFLKWDKNQNFESFYLKLTGEEEKDEQQLEI